jgi:membrane dipeptidase
MDPAANLAFLPELSRYRAAGVDVVSLNVGYGEMNLEAHLLLIAQMRRFFLQRTDKFLLLDVPADALRAKAEGKLGVTFDIEGAAPLGEDVERVEDLKALGVRWMLLAYNRTNAFGAGCHEATDEGLTPLGRRLLQRMADVGMVACLSHTGYRTARDALEMSPNPPIFSHSNPRALQDHPRNIPDDLIRLCGARGGVVGVNGLELFLGGQANAARVAEHVDYLVSLIGPQGVGLGLDFVLDLPGLEEEKASMAATFPKGLGYEAKTVCVPPEAIGDIADALLGRGYAKADVESIMGGNWLRIAEGTW